MEEQDYKIVVSTYSGLEEVLSSELLKLGAKNIEAHNRAVTCSGDKGFIYKANFSLRTALRVMIMIGEFKIRDGNDIYENVLKVEWEQYMRRDQTFAVRCILSSDLFDNNLFPALKAKDAVADYFRKKYNARPDVNREDPDLDIWLFINGNSCTLMLNTSGESLHKRGYRREVDRAPLSEVLAAGMVMISGWEPHTVLVDFMCGSGTIPIEAALYAAKIPPGTFRKKFGFEKWINFDQELFNLIRDKQIERITDLPVRIYGNELNKFVLKKAIENCESAGVEDMVKLSSGDFRDFPRPEPDGTIIINPPYGEKLSEQDVISLYKDIGDKFKQSYAGYKAWILTGNPDGAKAVGLRASRKIKLFNGAIECRFLRYELFSGSKKASKQLQ